MTTMSTSTTASNPSKNMTSEEIEDYLDQLQDDEFPEYIPAFLFLLLLSVTGLVGNVLVLLVYRSKYPKSATRIFIMCISIFDLITNVVCIPGRMYEMFYLWNFVWPSLCRVIRYANTATTITSACVLLAVAVSRYKKICKPFGKQVSVKEARNLCVGIAIFGWIVSIPFSILNGSHSRPTPIKGIVGYDCFIDDDYIDTIWPLANYGFFLLLFLSICIPLVVLYCLIGIKAYKHSKMHGVRKVQMKEKSSSQSQQIASKTSTSDISEDKSQNGFFALFKRKNNSKEKHSKAEESSDNRKTSMTQENLKREKTDDGCVPNKDEKELQDVSMLPDLTLELDLIKVQGEVCDGEEMTNDDVTVNEHNNGIDHELKDEADLKFHDGVKSDDIDVGDPGTCPDSERTNYQLTLNTGAGVDDLEKPDAQSGLAYYSANPAFVDTLTTQQAPKDDDRNEEERNRYSDVDNNSIGEEKIETPCPNNTPDSCKISHAEGSEMTIQPPEHTAKTHNGTTESLHTSALSSETTGNLEKNKIQLTAVVTKNSKRSVFNKTTGMLFLITAVFIVCFIPHLAIVFFRYTQPAKFKAMGTSSLTAHHLFFRSYLLNSAANPLVYSLCDSKFRHNVLCLFKNIFKSLKCCRSFKCSQRACCNQK